MDKEAVEKIESMLENSEERNFIQTVDLIINLGDIDLKDPENRFSTDVVLPNGRGKKRNVCVIADAKITQAKKLDVNVISKDDLEELEGKRDKAKEIADKNDYFLGEAPLMPKIGQVLGPVLGPRGKMPNPFPPGADLKKVLGKSQNAITIKIREDKTLHFPVGTENMSSEEIKENADAVVEKIGSNLPKGSQQIDSVYIKLTMSKPERLI